jgi:hypothetical protein
MDRDLTNAQLQYLLQFMRTGDPNVPGLPALPRYTRATDQYFDFGNAGIREQKGLLDGAITIFEEMPVKDSPYR